MPKKMLVADLLCGAGGSSTGAQRALRELGLDMELVCVNHWPTAIKTHELNHPEARHFVQDIATVRPHLLVPEGYLDLLMASPTCTHHSVARGGKPTSDQQRSDPWHIITWLTELRVKRIIIENVWEFCGWGPVNMKTGRPIASRKGEYFHAWTETLRRLGFELEWRKLNAADYGDATTRQRFILMGRSDGRKIHWPMPTHKKRDEVNADLFSGAKPWKPARDIIDWNIKGRSILNRKKPLAPKTLARIYAGAVKFGWPEPYLVILRNHMSAQAIDQPLPTIAANGMHIGIAEPIIMNGRKGNKAEGVSEGLIPTLDTKGGVWLAEPMVLSQHNSGAARTVQEPLPTITTGGAANEARPGCARPMLVTVAHGTDVRDKDPYTRRSHDIEDPLGAIHGDGSAYAVIEPFVLSQASGGSPRGVSEPIPTQTTGGNGASHALISPYYGSGSGETCNSVNETLPTITSKGRFGMVVPVTNSNGGAQARNIDVDPLPTMTTAKGGEFAAVLPITHAGGLNRVSDVSAPLPTVTGANRGELAMVEPHGEYDILFRMLEPHELAAAMGFNNEEMTYEFAGTKTEKIKQIGNAVSVAKMKACVGAIMADAAPKPKAKSVEEFLEAAE
ncbi:DNA cytosine methyltransferase [Agrobacterium tumefaciens]|uniref:DNA cytosine methyltransferase n=1 Tax=Agrobacterium tumefaciens TaxID=358 RepID=UPI0021D3919A|nr:DNA cytosine methyltransferase [Agrobacterium tumefaciens]UXS24216.1 DNA cytosine methyltransferase [Agrobacterium tumefaciens]UXS52382.1 DNA cytosine methyltransferase [Agrobacterium tumefaciens]UXS62628.1 DNA cytosine methyltransferase [Agrobacterium tumefaciens]